MIRPRVCVNGGARPLVRGRVRHRALCRMTLIRGGINYQRFRIVVRHGWVSTLRIGSRKVLIKSTGVGSLVGMEDICVALNGS